jgi:hypothetical protein
MTHPDRDEAVLLFAHRQLPLLSALALRAHLATCPDCRLRLREFESVSRTFAHTVRDANMSQWCLRVPSRVTVAIAALTVIALIAMGTLALRGLRGNSHSSAPVGVTGQCRPDLPNDRCR